MLLFVWIGMQEYPNSKTIIIPNSVSLRDLYCLTMFMLKLHEIRHPIKHILGVLHKQELKWMQEAGKLPLMGGWVRWVSSMRKIMQQGDGGNHHQAWCKAETRGMSNMSDVYSYLNSLQIKSTNLQNQDNQHLCLSSDVWPSTCQQSNASAVVWLHFCKSPLIESHSFPCGCLATPLQHNIVRINRVKAWLLPPQNHKPRVLSHHGGCSQHRSNKCLRFNTT